MDSLTALADWAGFFTAQIGSSAALAGLLFVGVSLNLKVILSASFLPLRALLALALLIGILVVSSLMMMPGQTRVAVAVEVLAVGVVAWVGGSLIEIRGWRHAADGGSRTTYVANALLLQFATVPYLVAAALLFAGNDAGLYWLAAAVILSTIKAVADAWVLLVEINR
jgi:modulator of FtsH protease